LCNNGTAEFIPALVLPGTENIPVHIPVAAPRTVLGRHGQEAISNHGGLDRSENISLFFGILKKLKGRSRDLPQKENKEQLQSTDGVRLSTHESARQHDDGEKTKYRLQEKTKSIFIGKWRLARRCTTNETIARLDQRAAAARTRAVRIVDDPPARQEFGFWSRHLIFLEKSGNRG
jgi:hypothetical protein